MIKNVYAIYDTKLEAYFDPIFARTHGEAIRMFETAVVKEGSELNMHAEDYTLFFVGEWNDQGDLVNADANLSLGNALQIKAQHASRQMPIIGGE